MTQEERRREAGQAAEAYAAALAIYEASGDPEAERVKGWLDGMDGRDAP